MIDTGTHSVNWIFQNSRRRRHSLPVECPNNIDNPLQYLLFGDRLTVYDLRVKYNEEIKRGKGEVRRRKVVFCFLYSLLSNKE